MSGGVDSLSSCCVNAMDEFVNSQNTYRENYPDTPFIPDDIKKLSGQEFLDITGLEVW